MSAPHTHQGRCEPLRTAANKLRPTSCSQLIKSPLSLLLAHTNCLPRGHDEKTYDDYKATNLDSVVRIDRDKATDKDKLYAKREVKLEYRDDHGRLLTRKEAFRQLCYQFHGYGSGKKNEEKRLKIIERENEAREQRTNEQRGTMGALKKAQKNTGKAYLKLS